MKHLAAHHCVLPHEGANHAIYLNPGNGQQTAVPRRREVGEHTGRAICKQLGIPLLL